MKVLIRASLFLFTCINFGPSFGQDTVLNERIRQLLDVYEQSLSSQSSESVALNFHPDAQLLPEGKPIVIGRAAIEEHFIGLESIEFAERFTVEDVIEAGEYVIIRTVNRGSWSNPETKESGAFEVKGLMVLKPDEEGNLKIHRYAYNGNGEG